MKHLTNLFAFLALIMGTTNLYAQTDVTNTYITNADFSSTEGWTQEHSTQYWALGNGLIGTYAVENNKTSTTDDTHLATEYCLGIQCRWSTNYANFTQTTPSLPAGVYTLSFDVENTNTSTTFATYENRFTITVGETTYTDEKKEWMSGNTGWTTHTISFTLTEAATATISLGYGTGSNNYGSSSTPHLYVSHLKLTYQSLLDGLKAQWDEAYATAKAALANQDYTCVTGEERTALEAEIAKDEPTTQEGYEAAITSLQEATETFIAAKDAYSAFNTASSCEYPILVYAATAKRTALDEACNVTPTSATDAEEKTAAIYTALRAYYESNGSAEGVDGAKDFTSYIKNPDAEDGNNGWTWTGNKNNPANTEPWTDSEGNSTHKYFDGGNWNASSWTTTMQQDITLPPGKYLLSAMGRAAVNTTLTMSVGDVSVELPHAGNTGNVFGNGWGEDVLLFESDGLTASTILVTASSSTIHEWFSISRFRLTQLKAGELSEEAIAALIATIPEGKMNAEVKATMDAAKTTLETEKTKEAYDALAEAIANAEASIQAYIIIKSYIDYALSLSKTEADFSAINDAYNNGTYADDTEAAVIYEAYQAAEIAALAASNAEDFTSVIINPSFETGDMTGWSAESRSDTGVKANNNATYTTSNVDGDYLFNSWGGSAENNVYQTIKGIPAGTYTLSALVAGFNGEELIVSANETTNSVVVAGDKTTGYTVNVVFTLDAATDVTIKASNTKSTSTSDHSFIKADNFKLIAGDITTDDYTALNAAIADAETKTLGFDEGEYAPYNNVAAVTALATAKAVNQDVAIAQTTLNEIVEALASATWTVNTEEVNCIYDGQFANTVANVTSGEIDLPGWTKVQGLRMLVKNLETYPSLAYTDGKAAVFSWGGTTLTYGEQTGYTLPMNKGERYELTFKVTGWSDGDLPNSITITLDGNAQTVDTEVTGRINDAEGNPFKEMTFYLKPTADNSILTINANKHFVIADLNLMKASALPGDVNGDGEVNVADVTALVNCLLSTDEKPDAADVDGDEDVDADDVKALLQIILAE